VAAEELRQRAALMRAIWNVYEACVLLSIHIKGCCLWRNPPTRGFDGRLLLRTIQPEDRRALLAPTAKTDENLGNPSIRFRDKTRHRNLKPPCPLWTLSGHQAGHRSLSRLNNPRSNGLCLTWTCILPFVFLLLPSR